LRGQRRILGSRYRRNQITVFRATAGANLTALPTSGNYRLRRHVSSDSQWRPMIVKAMPRSIFRVLD
jgi:hypothetical protein